MRPALLVALLLVLGSVPVGCSHSACPSAGGARPAAASSGTPSRPIEVRFTAAASAGSAAQIFLLTTAPAIDPTTAQPVHDLNGHEILDPNADASLHTAATTVAFVRDFTGRTVPAESWLDERSHWDQAGPPRRTMRGQGIGSAPILPPAAPGGPFVTIGGATSVVRFPLIADDIVDAGVPSSDAGPAPAHAHEWEWPWPASTGAPSGGPNMSPPALADLVVVPRYLPDHDLAFVTRTSSGYAGQMSGGELFVLDTDDPLHVISLATVSFDSYADTGFHAVPASLAYTDEYSQHGVVYVALDHQDFGLRPSYGPGLIAVVDADTRAVRTVLRIPNLTNCLQIAPYVRSTRPEPPDLMADPGENHRLVVTCLGTAPATPGTPPADAGFVYIEREPDPTHLDRLPVITQTITALSLSLPRPDGGVMPLYGHWIAYVALGSRSPSFPDRVIAANLATGETQILVSTPTNNGAQIAGLGPGAFDPASGVLVVPNGFDGVLTWQVPRAFMTFESPTTTFHFSDPVTAAPLDVPHSGCSHVAVRSVRAVGGTGAPVVMPMLDAGMPADAATSLDAGVDAI